jgi:hypothetical protein
MTSHSCEAGRPAYVARITRHLARPGYGLEREQKGQVGSRLRRSGLPHSLSHACRKNTLSATPVGATKSLRILFGHIPLARRDVCVLAQLNGF